VQANTAAVEAVSGPAASEVLALQVLQLRRLVDVLSAQMQAERSRDVVDSLKAKQILRGREREPRVLGC
jgi:hypothetical protein